MTEGSYYFAEEGKPRGPLSLAEFATRSLAPTTLVWRDGMAEWQAAGSLPELAELFAKAAAAPAGASYDPSHEQAGFDAVAFPVPSDVPSIASPILLPTADASTIEYFHPNAVPPASGMAVTSLVLGIVSVLSFCGFHVGLLIGLPCSILAIVFGFIGLSKVRDGSAGGRSFARTGLILGFIYIGLWIVLIGAIIAIGIFISATHH